MIFLTIGTQEPFDRLVKTMDEIAPSLSMPVVGQISHSLYTAKNIKSFDFLSPTEFDYYFDNASLIVSHAGMGTIISALTRNKPLIILPRSTKFNEHRSDHQIATANVFKKLGYVYVADNENELLPLIEGITSNRLDSILHSIGYEASPSLINSIKNFIKEIN